MTVESSTTQMPRMSEFQIVCKFSGAEMIVQARYRSRRPSVMTASANTETSGQTIKNARTSSSTHKMGLMLRVVDCRILPPGVYPFSFTGRFRSALPRYRRQPAPWRPNRWAAAGCRQRWCGWSTGCRYGRAADRHPPPAAGLHR